MYFIVASKKNMSILILWLVWRALKFISFISMQNIVLTKLVEWNFEVQVTSIFGESTHYIILGHWVPYFILVELYISYSTITRTGHQFQARLTPKIKITVQYTLLFLFFFGFFFFVVVLIEISLLCYIKNYKVKFGQCKHYQGNKIIEEKLIILFFYKKKLQTIMNHGIKLAK